MYTNYTCRAKAPAPIQDHLPHHLVWDHTEHAKRLDVGQSLRRSGMGVLHVGVDVGAGHAEVDVIYISFIVSVQNIGYLRTTEVPCTVLDMII